MRDFITVQHHYIDLYQALHCGRTPKASPPKGNLNAQQRAFNRFLKEFNEIRTHQGLGRGICPLDVHRISSRPYPDKIPEMHYPDQYQVRKVKCGGYIQFNGHGFYLLRQLLGEHVGLEPIGLDLWQLYFGELKLAVVDERLKSVIRPK